MRVDYINELQLQTAVSHAALDSTQTYEESGDLQVHHFDDFNLRSGLFGDASKPSSYSKKQSLTEHHIDEFHLYSQAVQGLLSPVYEDSTSISIAYFLMVHRFPEQFKRLFNAIYHPDNHYLIHIDKKAEADILGSVTSFLKDYPNAHILKSQNIVWGGYSMVQSELDGMKFLLDLNLNWDFFINLSGQDFPLKSQTYIHQFLTAHRKTSFIRFENQATERPETMNRIDNYFEEDVVGYPVRSHRRFFLEDAIPYIGGQWMMLTRDCCEFLCNSEEIKAYEDFYKHTFIADEAFFQTTLMNSSFSGKLINDDKRAIVWIPDGDIKLRPKTFTEADLPFLQTGDNLFARKFDEKLDTKILYLLEANLIINDDFVNNLTLKPATKQKARLPREAQSKGELLSSVESTIRRLLPTTL